MGAAVDLCPSAYDGQDRRRRLPSAELSTWEERRGGGPDQRTDDAAERWAALVRVAAIALRQGVELPEWSTQDMVGEGISEFSEAESYEHVRATERERPDLARDAWSLHAESYVDEGFVNSDALVDDGHGRRVLSPEIDKAREPLVDVTLWLAYHKHAGERAGGKPVMGLRELRPPKGGNYKDLPAYQLSQSNLYSGDEGENKLAQFTEEGGNINEIGALSRKPGERHYVFHELFRDAIHTAIREDAITGHERAWLHTIVRSTYDGVCMTLGHRNFQIVGRDVVPRGPGVAEGLTLVPAVLYPGRFLPNLLASIQDMDIILDSPKPDDIQRAKARKLKRSLERSFLLYSDGLNPKYLRNYPEVIVAKDSLLRARKATQNAK